LADPREGEHILYVFGFQKKPVYTPISIPTNSVLERCEVVVPNFTNNEKAFCREITTKRNEELHSGGLGFDGYSTKKWLSKYFKTIKILLDFQEKTLTDFLGSDEARAAQEMIEERDVSLEKTVRDRISVHSKYFTGLTPEVQREKVINSESAKWTIKGSYKKDERCPSCGNSGVLTGKLISLSGAKAGETEIIQNLNVLPTEFKCFCCNLILENHLELDVVEMGGQYKVEEVFDPEEYFDLDYEPDFDYGND
jgi:excinuclease UvrABC ATPase subunit